jgi:hypothetical protein
MNFLPEEIFLHIFNFLDKLTLNSLALTCKQYYELCCQVRAVTDSVLRINHELVKKFHLSYKK